MLVRCEKNSTVQQAQHKPSDRQMLAFVNKHFVAFILDSIVEKKGMGTHPSILSRGRISFCCCADDLMNCLFLPRFFRHISLHCVPQVRRSVTLPYGSFHNCINRILWRRIDRKSHLAYLFIGHCGFSTTRRTDFSPLHGVVSWPWISTAFSVRAVSMHCMLKWRPALSHQPLEPEVW